MMRLLSEKGNVCRCALICQRQSPTTCSGVRIVLRVLPARWLGRLTLMPPTFLSTLLLSGRIQVSGYVLYQCGDSEQYEMPSFMARISDAVCACYCADDLKLTVPATIDSFPPLTTIVFVPAQVLPIGYNKMTTYKSSPLQ